MCCFALTCNPPPQFAFLQVKTIWAHLLRNFEFTMEGPMPEPNYESMVVGPKLGTSEVAWTRRKL